MLHRATCPLDCPDACGVLVETAEDGRFVGLRGNPEHPYSRGSLCGKTAIFDELQLSAARLASPLVRRGGKLVESDWDTALARIASRVGPLPGERILAAHYAGSMGVLAQRFPLRAMHALGAVDTDGGLCDNTPCDAWQLVYGRLVGADIETAEEADLIVIWGADIARSVQHLQPAVRRAARRGVPVAVVDVWRTQTMKRAERHGGRGFVIRPGSDAALALGLAWLAYERGCADRAFLARECLGADELEAHVRGAHDLAATARATGLSTDEVTALADLCCASRAPFVKLGVGFARRRHGGASMRALLSLWAVLGHAERVHFESAGAFALAYDVVERPDLRAAEQRRAPIAHVQLGRELESGRFGAVFIWGHNPVVTCPESQRVRAALLAPEVFVVVHEIFLTETAACADVVLPATTFVEHEDVYRSYGHRYLTWTRPAVRPYAEARSNVEAFGAIARALDLPRETWDVSSAALCEELLTRSPLGLDAAELDALRAGRPVKVRPPAQRRADGGHDWGTPSGRIELASTAAERLGQPRVVHFVDEDEAGVGANPDRALPYLLICAPSIHTHNSTYFASDRHMRRVGAPRVFAHPDDARDAGLEPGTHVALANAVGRLTLELALCADLPRGMLRIDGLFRGAQTLEHGGVNALVSADRADLGGGNVLYSTRVRLQRAEPSG